MTEQLMHKLIERVEALTRPTVAPHRLNTADAAAFLGYAGPRALEHLRRDGGGPKFQRSGHKVFYLVADLRAWADGQASFSNLAQANLYYSQQAG